MAGSITGVDSDSSATNATSYSFTVDTGTPASDREIVVCAAARIASTSGDISGLTIDGNPATLCGKALNTADGSTTNVLAVYSLAVPTGASSAVVVSFPVTMLRCAVVVFAKTGADTAVHATAPSSSLTSGNPSVNIAVPAGGVVAACFMNAANTTVTWAGPTEYADFAVEANTTVSGAAGNYASAQSPLAVSVTPANNAGSPTLLAVSWGPAASGGSIIPLVIHHMREQGMAA
ncbi:MAG: hypothetical protein E6Q76_19630 [Rhizobium sp.]|nr:MAG: hypothetical protein E6Q76_19630 [Rhizobium sp.]